MELMAAPILLIAVVLYVAWPLLSEEDGGRAAVVEEAELEATRVEKANVVESLKDLEMDFQMGKLSTHDYQALSEHLERRAVKVLQRLEALEGSEATRQRSSSRS